MEDSALLEALSSMIKQQIAPIQAEIAALKKESTSSFQQVNIALQEAKAEREELKARITIGLQEAKTEREEIKEYLSQVADTLEGGLSIVDKLEQRLNPVAEYVETMIFHANESNHT